MNVERLTQPLRKEFSLKKLKGSQSSRGEGDSQSFPSIIRSKLTKSKKDQSTKRLRDQMKSHSSVFNSSDQTNAALIKELSNLIENSSSRYNLLKNGEEGSTCVNNTIAKTEEKTNEEKSIIMSDRSERAKTLPSEKEQDNIIITLPLIRNKPARHIKDSYQKFKGGIYKNLYSPQNVIPNEKIKGFLLKQKTQALQNMSVGSDEPISNIRVSTQELENEEVSPNERKNSKMKNVEGEFPKEFEENENYFKKDFDSKEFVESFPYQSIDRIAKEVVELFKNEEFRHIFSDAEVRMIENSDESFKIMNPELYYLLSQDFNRDKNFNRQVMGQKLSKFLTRLRKIRLSELKYKEVFSKVPYEKKDSMRFFEAIKEDQFPVIRELLWEEPCLVFDYDYARMTPLHWAAKKNNMFLCEYFLDKGADINARDCVGRIPLYFALKNQNLEMVRVFLLGKALPWSSPASVSYDEVCQGNQKINHYIQKSRELHIIIQLSPYEMKAAIWDKEAPSYFGDRKKPKGFSMFNLGSKV